MNKTFYELKRKVSRVSLMWTIQLLMENGYKDTANISDEYIRDEYERECDAQEELKSNGKIRIYTPELLKEVIENARMLARETDWVDLIEFIQVEELILIEGRITWHRMSEIASRAIDGLREDDEENALDYLYHEVELDEEECEYFGVPIEEEEDE